MNRFDIFPLKKNDVDQDSPTKKNVCVYVCMCVRVYVCTFVRVYVWTCVHVCVFLRTFSFHNFKMPGECVTFCQFFVIFFSVLVRNDPQLMACPREVKYTPSHEFQYYFHSLLFINSCFSRRRANRKDDSPYNINTI